MTRKFFFACAGLLCLAVAFHLGTQSAGAQSGTAPEIAILTGTVPEGGTIPLPHYQDGTEALESECRRIATINTASASAPNFTGVWCYTTGRVVSVGAAGNCPCPPGVANYMIIATRVTGATATHDQSWSGLKARYR